MAYCCLSANQIGSEMQFKLNQFSGTSKFIAGVVVGAILFSSSAIAFNNLVSDNTPEKGYLLCANLKTKAVTFPNKLTCPSGTKALDMGAVTGVEGPVGPAGTDGIDGRQGAQGIQGERGATGLTGATGPQGLVGPIGLQGLTGPKGDPGTSTPLASSILFHVSNRCSSGWTNSGASECQREFTSGTKFIFRGFDNIQVGSVDFKIYLGNCRNDEGDLRFALISTTPPYELYSGAQAYCVRAGFSTTSVSWLSYSSS